MRRVTDIGTHDIINSLIHCPSRVRISCSFPILLNTIRNDMYYLFLVLTRNDTFLGHSGTWTTRMQFSIPSFNFQLSTPSPKSNTNRASSEWHLTRNGLMYCLNRSTFFKIRANCTRTNLETVFTNISRNRTVPGASDQL